MTDNIGSAGEKRSVEGRCDGLSVQFQAAKVVGGCDKHVSKGRENADRQQQHPGGDQLESADGVDSSSGPAQSDGAHIHLPGARRSLAGHHDKQNKKHSKGKHHDDRDDEDEAKDRKGDDKHNNQHNKKDLKHSDKRAHGKHCHMTFENAEGKLCIPVLLCCWLDHAVQFGIIGTSIAACQENLLSASSAYLQL